MSIGYSGLLGIGTLIFLVWAVSLFRAMFQVRRIAADRTNSINPGPFSTLAAWRVWLSDPARAGAKRLLLTSTALIILWVLGLALFGPSLQGGTP